MLHHPQLQIVCSDHSWPNFNKSAVAGTGHSVLHFSVWVTHVSIRLCMGNKTIAKLDLWP